jgi:uncharacterized protein YdaU (DUF1376 family)
MAPERSPAFQFYPKDFLTDVHVVSMTLQELGAYIKLLCLCWLERSLPVEPDALARLCRVSPACFSRIWPALEPCFTVSEGRLVQPRMEREREKQAGFRRRASAGGHALAQLKHETSTAKSCEVAALLSPISDLRTAVRTVPKKRAPAQEKEPPDPRVKAFLSWFQSEYTKRRNGASYLVDWARDSTTVKAVLGACELDRLQTLAKIMLSDQCGDPFIQDSDRGIGVLKVKFNWLSDRLA